MQDDDMGGKADLETCRYVKPPETETAIDAEINPCDFHCRFYLQPIPLIGDVLDLCKCSELKAQLAMH
jgi:hypothetical protein